MAEFLYLKSKLLKAADPWKVDVSQFCIPLTVNEALYEKDLLNFRRRFATTEDVGEVAAQDMVTLTCDSENKRFCKEHITIRIGMGLFSKELETALIGWRVGQMGTVTAKGQSVCVTVEGIRRENLPEVDDALAQRCGIPGIQNAQDIHKYCKGKQFASELEGPADEAFAYLSRAVLDGSEFELDAQELVFAQDKMVKELYQNPMFADGGFERMPVEEFRELFGCEKDDLVESMRTSGSFVLKSALLGQAILEQEGKLMTMGDYDAYIGRHVGVGGKDEAQVRQEKPLLGYIMDQYADRCMNELEELSLRRLQEAAV